MSKSSFSETHSKALFKSVLLGASLGANEAGPVTKLREKNGTGVCQEALAWITQ